MQEASDVITSLRVDDSILEFAGISKEEANAAGCVNGDEMSWIELLLTLQTSLPPDGIDTYLTPCLEFHQKVSGRMASHLKLTTDNIDRSTWLSAGILSSTASDAQAASRLLTRHLLTLKPHQQTEYEKALIQDETFMQQLSDFNDLPTPCVVWGCNGYFAYIFYFLGARF